MQESTRRPEALLMTEFQLSDKADKSLVDNTIDKTKSRQEREGRTDGLPAALPLAL